MAVEGAFVETPVGSQPVAPPTGTPSSDPKTTQNAGVKPVASQPEYKWDDDAKTIGMRKDLQTERTKRQEFEKAVAAKDAEAVEWKRKVEALTGLTPPSKDAADSQLVRGKLLELYPELADLDSIKEIKSALEQQQVQGYTAHSKQMLTQIHSGIAAEYGDLSDGQKKRINAAYLYENQTNPEFHARHNQGDPSLVSEFVKDYLHDMVEPIRSKVTASEAGRFRPVPGGRDRSSPMKGEKPIDPTDNKAVMDMLVSSRKGKFGR